MSAAHLIYLIDQLLSYARLEAGREELDPREFEVADLAREIAAVVEPLAAEKSLCFQLQVSTEPIRMHTDPDRLRQVLLNLVSNAVRYTPCGTVELGIGPAPDGSIAFQVRDTGVGIQPEHIHKIFEPFWQVDTRHRSSNSGTGLGLAVVRHLVELLGGELSVESEVGKGSVFTVRLPASREF